MPVFLPSEQQIRGGFALRDTGVYLADSNGSSSSPSGGGESGSGSVPSEADPPTNTAAPVLSGIYKVGEVLSVTNGTWTNSPDSYSYNWKADGVSLSAADQNTFTPTTAEYGKVITCAVTATNVSGDSSPATSNSSDAIVSVPFVLSGPTIDNTTPDTDDLLTLTEATWGGGTVLSRAHQWYADISAISGETGTTLQLTSTQLGAIISVGEIATNATGDSVEASSVGTDAVTLPPLPEITDFDFGSLTGSDFVTFDVGKYLLYSTATDRVALWFRVSGIETQPDAFGNGATTYVGPVDIPNAGSNADTIAAAMASVIGAAATSNTTICTLTDPANGEREDATAGNSGVSVNVTQQGQ